MKVIVLGADGYLGWPTCMYFAVRGYDVIGIDNYARRRIAAETDSEALFPNPRLPERADLFASATGHRIAVLEADCANVEQLSAVVLEHKPGALIHYAEQPSAPYSMRDAEAGAYTLHNNLGTTFAALTAIRAHSPATHLVKLGTMGEYGTPNIDIEEGWLDVEHNGRKDRFLFPRQAGSLYHTTKVLDTDLIWFFVRTYGLRVTDLMQGPVYGLATEETRIDDRLLPNFHYDDIFGTVLNRFITQAVAGIPLTVYGRGGQTRGYLNLTDTLQCVKLAVEHPPETSELRIFNQFTETFSVRDLAEKVAQAGREAGYRVEIASVPNPRLEQEEHYYNPKFTGLASLGLQPSLLTQDVLTGMLQTVAAYRDRIDAGKILPRVRWSEAS